MAAYWPTAESDLTATDYMVEFARAWNPKPKIVFSSTLPEVGWNGRLVRGDPVEKLSRLVATRTFANGAVDFGYEPIRD